MFFILSKITGLLLSPIVWIVVLLFLSIFTKKQTRRKKFKIIALVLLLFFSNSFIFNEIIGLYEKRYENTFKLNKKYDYGIVLSGMVTYNFATKQINFQNSSDRIWQAVKLYKNNNIDKILITGGAANIFARDTAESVLLRDFLINIGIPAESVVIETQSRNTYQNAIYTAKITGTNKTLLLITSAIHMGRSQLCFKKAGLNCHIYSTDFYSTPRRYNIDNLIVPSSSTLFNWTALIHEIFGLFTYKIMGYI